MNLVKLTKNKIFLKLNSKVSLKTFIFFLLVFSVYCSLIIGKSWDEDFHLFQGKNTLDYLFSLGKINNYHLYRENYSPIYGCLKYLLTQIFPSEYRFEVNHLANLLFSLSAIIGTGKLCKELFNQKVGRIVFLILFFYPIFFGHMAFNNKDMILAFCHVWIFYLVLRYLKKQNIENKAGNYIVLLAFLGALGTGVQLVFLGTLIPIFLFFLIDIFFLKKFTSNNFSKKKFYIDIVKIILVFYFILILFWIDTHPNVLILPFSFLLEHLYLVSGDEWRGWPFNLFNGQYYMAWQLPKLYFFINFIYKSPEYILLSYIIFFTIFLNMNSFFKKKFNFFIYKLILLMSIIITSILVGFIAPLKYDGMRHILWSIPYFCIIPGLTIYYLIENFRFIKSKVLLISLAFFIIYFLFNFFMITPYQYTYLNILNGKTETHYKKFENDYWGSSIKELIKNKNIDKDKNLKFGSCGINPLNTKDYLKNNGYTNFVFVDPGQAEYIIMTNRATRLSGSFTLQSSKKDNELVKLTNCFDKFQGKNVAQVERNGVLLSVIRKYYKTE